MKRIITILICLLPLIALEQSPFTCGNLTVKGTEKITNIPYVSLPSDTGDYNVLFWNKTTDKVYRGSILGTTGSTGPTGPTGLQGATGATGSGGSGSAWGLTGNTGTNSGTNFIGTTDNHWLKFKTNNQTVGWFDTLMCFNIQGDNVGSVPYVSLNNWNQNGSYIEGSSLYFNIRHWANDGSNYYGMFIHDNCRNETYILNTPFGFELANGDFNLFKNLTEQRGSVYAHTTVAGSNANGIEFGNDGLYLKGLIAGSADTLYGNVDYQCIGVSTSGVVGTNYTGRWNELQTRTIMVRSARGSPQENWQHGSYNDTLPMVSIIDKYDYNGAITEDCKSNDSISTNGNEHDHDCNRGDYKTPHANKVGDVGYNDVNRFYNGSKYVQTGSIKYKMVGKDSSNMILNAIGGVFIFDTLGNLNKRVVVPYDGYVKLPLNTTGWGTFVVDNDTAIATFDYKTTGSFHISSSSGLISTTNHSGYIYITDSLNQVWIRNYLNITGHQKTSSVF